MLETVTVLATFFHEFHVKYVSPQSLDWVLDVLLSISSAVVQRKSKEKQKVRDR